MSDNLSIDVYAVASRVLMRNQGIFFVKSVSAYSDIISGRSSWNNKNIIETKQHVLSVKVITLIRSLDTFSLVKHMILWVQHLPYSLDVALYDHSFFPLLKTHPKEGGGH